MADNGISPEERLFNVIQNGKKPGAANVEVRGKNERKPRFLAIKQGYELLKAKIVLGPRSKAVFGTITKGKKLDYKIVNIVLAVVLVIFTALTVDCAVYRRPSISKIIDSVSKITFRPVEKGPIERIKPLAFYSDEVHKRNIFQPLPDVQKEHAFPNKNEEKEKLEEAVAGLKLQGITWGAVPKAIIKNESEGKVFFLKQGQTIGLTKIEVKAISKNKVVLSYEGEEIEL